MKRKLVYRSFRDGLAHFLTPEVWKQAHQACPRNHTPSRWALHPLVWVMLSMAWLCGGSLEEKFATARAAYVACHQSARRPGKTLAGLLTALARLPMPVLRALSRGVRGQLETQFVDALRINGWLPMACDGSRLACPRSQELQQRLGEAGKTGSSPMVYLSALVLLPVGVLWSWRLGKGTADELDHLQHMLPTLPRRALLVADAFYLGYDMFRSIVLARASFLVRLSSRAYLYTMEKVCLDHFSEGLAYYWPEKARDAGQPPLEVRVLRVRGRKADVWLMTNLLDPQELSHRTAAQVYRWRWRNEGLFRFYKGMLGKVKLQGRKVAEVHREAEISLLALQLLLAMAAQELWQGPEMVVIMDSPRRVLLRIRGDVMGLLRSLGPRQFAEYRRMLAVVRSEERVRTSAKVRQEWPRRKDHKPPKPPKFKVMDDVLKAKLVKALQNEAA